MPVAHPTRFTLQMIEEYTGKGYWDTATLSEICEVNAREHPDRKAIADSRTCLTWPHVNELVDRLASRFTAIIRARGRTGKETFPMKNYLLGLGVVIQ